MTGEISNDYCVYALIDPRDSSIFYVGRTGRHPSIRLEEHLDDCIGSSPKQIRIREIQEEIEYKKTWLEIGLVVLENNIATEKKAFLREVFWIELLSVTGTHLENASIDYDGIHFLSTHHLENSGSSGEDQVVESSTKTGSRMSWNVNLEDTDKINEADYGHHTDGIFKIENCPTITFMSSTFDGDKFNPLEMRKINNESGRRLNHGFPITKEEIELARLKFSQGENFEELEKFFQRNRLTIEEFIN